MEGGFGPSGSDRTYADLQDLEARGYRLTDADEDDVPEVEGVTVRKGVVMPAKARSHGGIRDCVDLLGHTRINVQVANNLATPVPYLSEVFEPDKIHVKRAQVHPSIAVLYDVIASKDGYRTYVIQEAPRGDDAMTYMKKMKCAEHKAREVFAQVAEAIFHCHKEKYDHGEVRSGSVRIDKHGDVKILDLGLSRKINPKHCYGRKIPPTAHDMFNLGVLLYELLHGCRPGPGTLDEMERSLNLNHIKIGPTVPRAAVQLMYRLMDPDPMRRPLPDDVRNDPWMLGVPEGTAIFRQRKRVILPKLQKGTNDLIKLRQMGSVQVGEAQSMPNCAMPEKPTENLAAKKAKQAKRRVESPDSGDEGELLDCSLTVRGIAKPNPDRPKSKLARPSASKEACKQQVKETPAKVKVERFQFIAQSRGSPSPAEVIEEDIKPRRPPARPARIISPALSVGEAILERVKRPKPSARAAGTISPALSISDEPEKVKTPKPPSRAAGTISPALSVSDEPEKVKTPKPPSRAAGTISPALSVSDESEKVKTPKPPSRAAGTISPALSVSGSIPDEDMPTNIASPPQSARSTSAEPNGKVVFVEDAKEPKRQSVADLIKSGHVPRPPTGKRPENTGRPKRVHKTIALPTVAVKESERSAAPPTKIARSSVTGPPSVLNIRPPKSPKKKTSLKLPKIQID